MKMELESCFQLLIRCSKDGLEEGEAKPVGVVKISLAVVNFYK